jgi:hypothetical protein
VVVGGAAVVVGGVVEEGVLEQLTQTETIVYGSVASARTFGSRAERLLEVAGGGAAVAVDGSALWLL